MKQMFYFARVYSCLPPRSATFYRGLIDEIRGKPNTETVVECNNHLPFCPTTICAVRMHSVVKGFDALYDGVATDNTYTMD